MDRRDEVFQVIEEGSSKGHVLFFRVLGSAHAHIN